MGSKRDNSIGEVLDPEIFKSISEPVSKAKKGKKGKGNSKGKCKEPRVKKDKVLSKAKPEPKLGESIDNDIPSNVLYGSGANSSFFAFANSPFASKILGANQLVDFLNSPFYNKLTSSINRKYLNGTSSAKKPEAGHEFLFSLSPSRGKGVEFSTGITPFINRTLANEFFTDTPQKQGEFDENIQGSILKSLAYKISKAEEDGDFLNDHDWDNYKVGLLPFLKRTAPKRKILQVDSPLRTPFGKYRAELDDINNVLMNFKTPKSLKKRIESFNFKDLNENLEEELNLIKTMEKKETDDATTDEEKSDNEQEKNTYIIPEEMKAKHLSSFNNFRPDLPPHMYGPPPMAGPPIGPPACYGPPGYLPGAPAPYYPMYANPQYASREQQFYQPLFETPGKQKQTEVASPSTISVSSAKSAKSQSYKEMPSSPTPKNENCAVAEGPLIPVMGTFAEHRKRKPVYGSKYNGKNKNKLQIVFADIKSISSYSDSQPKKKKKANHKRSMSVNCFSSNKENRDGQRGARNVLSEVKNRNGKTLMKTKSVPSFSGDKENIINEV